MCKVHYKYIIAVLFLQFTITGSAQAVSIVSSQVDLNAQADASNLLESDSDSNFDTKTSFVSYSGSVGANAAVSTSLSSSDVTLTATVSSSLITVNGNASASSNGSIDDTASAYADGSFEVIFNSSVTVDYIFNGIHGAFIGDGNSVLSLKNLSDDSFILLSEVLFSGEEMPMYTGTLAPGSYEFSANVNGFSYSDDFTHGFDTYSTLEATLELTSVPVPAALWLFLSGLLGIMGTQLKTSSKHR